MPRSFTVPEESVSKRSIVTKYVDGLSISKSLYKPGYWFVTDYPAATPANDLSSKHFITSGGYIETTGTLPERSAGWKSWEDSGVIPAGSWRRESSDGCELWCVWNKTNPEGRVDHVTMVHLPAGQEYLVPDQSNLFSACGRLSSNNRQLEDEKPYVLRTGARLVLAVEDAYFLHWSVNIPGL
jgi:hypothetical protein